MRQLRCSILANQPVSKRYWKITVDASALGESIRPGQFFHIRCDGGRNNLLRRPFSVYRWDPESGALVFLYLVKGEGTRLLTEKKAGELLDLIGPLGHGFTLPSDGGAVLLVGRGVGVATLHMLAWKARMNKRKVAAITSARTRADLLAGDDLKHSGAAVYPVTDEEGTSSMAHVHQLIEMLTDVYKCSSVYTCGSRRLAGLVQDFAMHKNLYAEMAVEAHMACGIGDCYACACQIRGEAGRRHTVRVCCEGPVFPIRQVILE